METVFTPALSLAGGILIGLSAVFLMLVLGRIMGATGILSGLVFPLSRQEFNWRAILLAGMVVAPFAVYLFSGQMPQVQVPISLPMLIGGGLLVGFGVSLGGGCTSGHGVCGIARFSVRSIVATCTFMAFAFLTVFIIRHILGA